MGCRDIVQLLKGVVEVDGVPEVGPVLPSTKDLAYLYVKSHCF